MKLNHLIIAAAAALTLATSAVPVQAHEYYAKSFKIIHPWALPTEPGATSAAVYVKFEEIAEGDKLISAHTSFAEKVELRGAAKKESSKQPAAIKAVDLPAGATVDLLPEGAHLMLLNLTAPLQWGRSYPLTLQFEKSGAIEVMVSIGAH